jgi:hypothetical protein
VEAKRVQIRLLPGTFAVCTLPLDSELQMWFLGEPFFAMVRSGAELTVVCSESAVPEGVRNEPGWKALKVDGTFAFSETGILESIARPLAEAQIGIFAISDFSTDYVLVKAAQIHKAAAALSAAGHSLGEKGAG